MNTEDYEFQPDDRNKREKTTDFKKRLNKKELK